MIFTIFLVKLIAANLHMTRECDFNKTRLDSVSDIILLTASFLRAIFGGLVT